MSMRQAASLRPLRVVRDIEGGADSARPLSDQELIDALCRGDSQKSTLLYDRLIGTVDGTLVRILGRREQDHNDLVQSVFEQIIVSLVKGRFRGTCGLVGWAAAVACNFGLNALRSRIRERKLVDRGRDGELEGRRAEGPVDIERQVLARRELARMCEELAAMSSERATAVLLFDVFGYELGEMAELTGVSVTAAQSRLVRGRKELQQRMERVAESVVEAVKSP
jgi:RNA polymerase sigma-70 factor, ECF subfamily